MEQIVIRPALESDVDFIAQCLFDMLVELAQFGGEPVHERTEAWAVLQKRAVMGFENSYHTFMLAEETDSDRRAGIIEMKIVEQPAFMQPKQSMHIHTIYAIPELRGHGIGKALYNAALYWGRKMKCVEVQLHVLEDNPARLYYEQMGFRRSTSLYTKPLLPKDSNFLDHSPI